MDKITWMIPPHVENVLPKLRRWANELAGYYGSPVWLVGSALAGDNPSPRDWDVRIELPDGDFDIRFGNVQDWINEGVTGEWTGVRWRWSKQCTKETKAGWYRCRLNIDFQIYPKSHCEVMYPATFPRVRLDETPPDNPAPPQKEVG